MRKSRCIPECLTRSQPEGGGTPSPSKNKWLEWVLEQLAVRAVTAVLHRCSPQWKMPPRRIGDEMLFYVLQGEGETHVDGRRHPLRPGSCASFHRGVEHSATHDPKKPFQVIALHYTASVFGSLSLPELTGFPDVFQNAQDIEPLLLEACQEGELHPLGWARGLDALTTRILLQLIRRHSAFLFEETQEPRFLDLIRLLPAFNAMKKNLAVPVRIPAMARAVGFSQAQFRRVFARATGTSPLEHQVQLRMAHACSLLRTTSKTIGAIAEEVGYGESAAFAHRFKKQMKIAPGKYRRDSMI